MCKVYNTINSAPAKDLVMLDHIQPAFVIDTKVVISIINIILNAISIATGKIAAIVSIIIISGVILYYLYRPHVKAFLARLLQV
jgi:hypothetical protein